MAAGVDLERISTAFRNFLPPVPALRQHSGGGGVHENGWSDRLAVQVGRVQRPTLVGQDSVSLRELPGPLPFFADSTGWWDDGRTKVSPWHLNFVHKESRVPLWLDNPRKPAWVDSHVATMGGGPRTTNESDCMFGQGPRAVAAAEGNRGAEICTSICGDGPISGAVDALDLLVLQGFHVSHNLFYRVLKRCIQDRNLEQGIRIHGLIVKSGYEGYAFLATHVIGLYASHGRLEEAKAVFTKVSSPDVYNWATIILAYARQGEAAQAAEAICLYRLMSESNTVKPDDRIYTAVLKACATAGDLTAGKEVHTRILASSGKPDRFVQAGLVNMYAKCGCLENARRMFDRLADKDVVTWTAMIAGYAQKGMAQEAVNLYRSMQQEGLTRANSVTYVCLLQACASVGAGALDDGKKLHAEIKRQGMLQQDMALGGSLVNMYAKCGSLEDARSLFDELPRKNTVAWNAMIAAYAQQGLSQDAFDLYRSMQTNGLSPDCFTFVSLLQACATVGVRGLDDGKQLHAQIKLRRLQEDRMLEVSLITMYAKCCSLEDARSLFDKLPDRNIVAWNAMIAGYAQQGMGHKALNLYRLMQHEGPAPNSVTYVGLLQACASLGGGALDEGKQVHVQIQQQGLEEDVVLGGSLVNMYVKCGKPEEARIVFDKLPNKHVVTWTSMIAGYVQQGMGQEALSLYRSMLKEGLAPPDGVTYSCLLQACAGVGVGALAEGKQLHAEINARGLQEDAVLAVSLVHMYIKCGSLRDAQRLFETLPDRDVITWTALIAGYSQRGMDQEALHLYRSMRQEGLAPPDPVTYVCLLQVCSNVGLEALDEGKRLHVDIEKRGLLEDVALGGSLVKMYAKCGSLKDAHMLFEKLPEKNVDAWNAMIAGYAQQGMAQDALSLYGSMLKAGSSPDSVTYVCLLQACATVAALPLGQQLHAEIEAQGLQIDGIMGVALINMYAKCGSMSDSQRVFDALSERGVEAWSALVSGYARHGDSQNVFDLLDGMKLEGVNPNGITLLSVLTVCSHVGLVDKGREYFNSMRKDYGIIATLEHFICMVDLLGRAGHLEEALQMVKTMPFPANETLWHSLLSACQKWKNVEIGEQAFEAAVRLDEKDAAAYVLMSNIYSAVQMWEAAKGMQARRTNLGAWKKPGQSWWTDMGGDVHTFLVSC